MVDGTSTARKYTTGFMMPGELFFLRRYEKALAREMVEGDPKGGFDIYRKLYGSPPSSVRSVAVTHAFIQMISLCFLLGLLTALTWEFMGSEDPFYAMFLGLSCCFFPIIIVPFFFIYLEPALGKKNSVPSIIIYRAAATMGMMRCCVLGGKEEKAREYALTLLKYPVEPAQVAGQAALSFMNGNLEHSLMFLEQAKRAPNFPARPLQVFVDALDRCGAVFSRKNEDVPRPSRLLPREMVPELTAPKLDEWEYHHHKKMLQNIGEFITGDRIELEDCVVNRSEIGCGPPEEQDLDDREEVLERYWELLEDVWEDGELTDHEFAFLQMVRDQECISLAEHLDMEETLLRRMGLELEYPCSQCGERLRFIKDEERWYCDNCGDFIVSG